MISTSLRLAQVSGLVLAAAAFTACNKASFDAQSPRQGTGNAIPAATPTPTPKPDAKTPPVAPVVTPVHPGDPQELSLTCDQLTNPSTVLNVKQVGSAPTQVKVKGQICPNVSNSLTVLFIVDWSGSMDKNDPVINGGCGRSQAAQAILNYIKGQAAASVAIKVAEIPFSTDVVQGSVVQPTALADFLPQISADSFCQASGTTNYVAAFKAAQQMLTGVAGRQVIYFISDGSPNIDATGNDSGSADTTKAVADSIAAGKALLSGVPGLTMDSLLLGAEAPQAKDVMVQIAGSPDRVQVVAQASQLASSILTFPATVLDATTVKAQMTGGAAAAAPVQVASFAEGAATPGIWTFETAPLTLVGVAGATTVDTVTLTVNGNDGSKQQAVVSIHYTEN